MKTLNEKEKSLVADLKAVMEKHGVKLDEYDEYDGEEAYCGTKYELVGEGIGLEMRELSAVLP